MKNDLSTSYIELLKNGVLGELTQDFSIIAAAKWWQKPVRLGLNKMGYQLVKPVSTIERSQGLDWPKNALTMIGKLRLENIQHCVEDVLKNNVAGDFIETGVWRGGACILMRGLLLAHGDTTRKVWVADSFEGLPPSVHEVDKNYVDGYNEGSKDVLAVSQEEVQATFAKFGLLDDQVVFLKGWFKDTLPSAPKGPLAIARLDGDLYESTMDAITALYPRLAVGGYLIIDDYNGWITCKIAVDEYRKAHNINEPIVKVDWTGVYWKKEN